MEADSVKEIYNEKIRGEYKGEYEYSRWFLNPRKRAGYEMTEKSVKRHILRDLKPFRNYLEVGPGEGTWTKFFVEKQNQADFDLVDISGEMLKLTKNKLGPAANIQYFESDFIGFAPDKKYDLFFSCRAIEYFVDKKEAVKKIADLLESGGRGFIITKNPHYLRSRIFGRKLSVLHQGQILPGDLKKILRENGFEKIEIYPTTFVFPLFHSVALDRWLFKIFGGQTLNFFSRFFCESYLIKFIKP